MPSPTPYRDQEPYLYLVHSPRDTGTVRSLGEQLERNYRLWYDAGDGSSQLWTQEMEERLLGCTALVMLITPSFAFSHVCRTALTRAILYNKLLIPVLLSPGPYTDGLTRQLQSMQPLSLTAPGSEAQLLPMLLSVPVLQPCQRPDAGVSANSFATDPAPETDGPSRESTFSRWTLSRRVQPPKIDAPPPISGHFFNQAAENTSPPVPNGADDGEVKTVIIASQPEPQPQPQPDDEDDTPTVIIKAQKPALLLHIASGSSYVLTKPQVKLGRSRHKCDIVLEGSGSVSNEHAQILCYDGRYVLMDLGSSNGTFLEGRKLEKDSPTELKGMSVFWLHDQVMVLLTGESASHAMQNRQAELLLNSASTAGCMFAEDQLALNRSKKWPDGTLSDPKVHRNSHARLVHFEHRTYLVDESPEGGNGTFLNERRLMRGTAWALKSQDKLRLGDTVLQYLSIPLQGDSL